MTKQLTQCQKSTFLFRSELRSQLISQFKWQCYKDAQNSRFRNLFHFLYDEVRMSYAFKSIRMEPVSKNLQIQLQSFEKTAGTATVSSPKPKELAVVFEMKVWINAAFKWRLKTDELWMDRGFSEL